MVNVVFFDQVRVGAREIGVVAGDVVTIMENSMRACTGGVFSLGLSEQTVAISTAIPCNGITLNGVHRIKAMALT